MSDDNPSTITHVPTSPPAPPDPLAYIVKTPTGASLAAYDADPYRKGLRVPNEDSSTSQRVTLADNADPGAQLQRVVQHVVDRNLERQDGATISAALMDKGVLYTSHLGDSPVLVVTYDPSNVDQPVTVKQVTKDHLASREEERALLPNPAAAAIPGRTWRVFKDETHEGAGLMTTRFGGLREWPLNRTPEATTHDLHADLKPGNQVFVVVGSDALIERTSVPDIEKMLNIKFKEARGAGKTLNADEVADLLAKHKFDVTSGSVVPYRRDDDTTIMVQQVTANDMTPPLPGGKREASLLVVSDGTGFKFQPLAPAGPGGEQAEPAPLYPTPLSQVFTEEIGRFMQSPGLMSDAVMARRPSNS